MSRAPPCGAFVVLGPRPAAPHWTGLVLGVHPDHQGTGVGRAVIEAALERVTGGGAPVMETMWRPA
jgi:GNAT superfamily N-acetyltransferase